MSVDSDLSKLNERILWAGDDAPISCWLDEPSERSTSAAASAKIDGAYSDVVVIGGGVIGLSAAFHLRSARPQTSVTVIEQALPGYGSTGRSFGILTPTLFDSPRLWSESQGPGQASRSAGELREAVAWLCEMRLAKRTEALIVFAEDEECHRLQAIRDLYLSLGVRARIASADDLKRGPYRRACGIVLSDHGMIDPAMLAKALSEKLATASVPVANMVTALRVREADGGAVVQTDCGEIRARVVLAATSGRPLEGVPSLDIEHRLSGGVLAERQAGDAWDIDKALYMDAGQHAFSARIVTGDRLLFGRSRAVGGTTVAKAASELMIEIEEEFARRLPNARILSKWYGPTFRKLDFRPGFTIGGGGRVARLFACNGRGLLTGFLLGKHVGYSLGANPAMPPCQASFPEFPALLDA